MAGEIRTNSIIPYDPHIVLRPMRVAFGSEVFCAAPTVLQAINVVLLQQGSTPLWTDADGAIGPSDPLLYRLEYAATSLRY